MKKLPLAAASAAILLGQFAGVSPSLAAPATTDVSWRYEMGSRDGSQPPGCFDPKVTSDKHISNLVYVIDGETIQIEFEDGTYEYIVPGEVTEVWVKSGNNKSGQGGLGQYFVPIVDENCLSGGGGPTGV